MNTRPMILNALDPRRAREQFAALNAQHAPAWNLETAGGVGSLHIYGAIGGFWGDVDAAALVPAIRNLDVATLEVFINSPGGDVWDGIAIRNALRQHSAHIVTHVDGLAASAASFIAAAGDEVVMGDNSQLMIHDAWTIMLGNAEDMRETANLLDMISESIASMYAAKAGGDVADWRALMKAETWYSAQEAVAAGLADRLMTAESVPAAASFDLSLFAHAGRTAAPAPLAPAALAPHREKEIRMNRAQLLAALNAGTITQEQYDSSLATLSAMECTTAQALAPAIAEPGVAVAAEYAAGPQGAVAPARVTNRPQSLNTIMPDLLDAVGRSDIGSFVQTVNNAITDNPTLDSNDAGEAFLQSERIGQVWTAHPEGRPVISSLGAVRPLNASKIEGWRWVEPTPAPEPYVGDLAAIESDAWVTEAVSKTPSRWAKGNRIDRIYADLGSADLIASMFSILDRNYEGVSDTAVFGDLVDGASSLTGGATSVLNAIAKSYLQLKRIGAAPGKFWMAEDVYLAFTELKVSDLPAWLANATGFVNLRNGSASLDSIFDVDVNFDLDDGGFIAYDPRSVTVFESPKVKLQAQVIGNGGIDIGWFAYGGTLINDARALVHTTIGVAVYTLEVTGTPTGGDFTVTINGHESAAIAYNASAGTIQTALNAVDDGVTGITVTGTTVKTVTFPAPASFELEDNGLTGGTAPTVVVTPV